jgi:DNA replication and repair protein RecF
VHLAQLRLRDFRNYTRLDASFSPGFHLLIGNNAQGKTNVLEAIYLLATLRSFRGVGGSQMIRHAQAGYFVGATVVHQIQHQIRMYWSLRERKLSLDGSPVRRITDYLGVLRVVVFCTEDLQLIKGTGRVRRRFLDLLLSQSFPDYLPTLQRYAQALRARNALLKRPAVDETALAGFSRELILAGDLISRLRRDLVPKLLAMAQPIYAGISASTESLQLQYQPNVKEDFAVELAQQRDREKRYRMTLVGPHRDELLISLDNQPATDFASEGQKRALAITLKMAQAEYLSGLHGIAPILLVDDIMGELDVNRRSGLIQLFERTEQARGQVFMTCTEENWPQELGRRIEKWEVKAGTLQRLPA